MAGTINALELLEYFSGNFRFRCVLMLLEGTKMKTDKSAKMLSVAVVAAALFTALFSGAAAAETLFDSNIPPGWTHIGGNTPISGYGSAVANGNIGLSPDEGRYGYVTTVGTKFIDNGNGCGSVGLGLGTDKASGCERNGSVLQSSVFTAAAGDELQFYFNYITSDGQKFSDYAWARLINTVTQEAILLFTARTTTDENTVPGSGMPAIGEGVEIVGPGGNPATPMIEGSGQDGGPVWDKLGSDSGFCYGIFGEGCGYTGWIQANYEFVDDGSYVLEFGVVNWTDNFRDSGLAFDGVTLTRRPAAVPEPASLALFGLGLMGLAAFRRRRA
ncbi:MAG: NF038132 family protein [Candidatus Accumulibacter sp.]|jgi:hypothetical protein|nr:NF038132 family protein [Accumulibacter sp.]